MRFRSATGAAQSDLSTSWESFYRNANPANLNAGDQPQRQAVNSLIFHFRGTAVPGNAGNGLYFDDVVTNNVAGTVNCLCGNDVIDEGETCEPTMDENCPGLCNTQTSECPLLVALESFTAEVTREGVLLRWSTSMEIDNAGFRLLRERVGQDEKARELITPEMIPARGSSLDGVTYEFLDTSPGSGAFRYYLQDVDFYGRTSEHPGVEIVVPKPGASRQKHGLIKR